MYDLTDQKIDEMLSKLVAEAVFPSAEKCRRANDGVVLEYERAF